MGIQIWDYIIEMKKEFMLKKRQVYPLLREERKDIYEFILKKLRKEYIRLLKLPQTVSVFLIGEKNSKKHIVQNYYYLNKWTIKNNHPLSLILDIVENIDTKKVFTKSNLCWSYNNVQIKEEDE